MQHIKTVFILALLIAGIGSISVMVHHGIESDVASDVPGYLLGAAFKATSAVQNAWESVRMSADVRRKISKLDNSRVLELPIPILLGVSPDDVYDSWGDARANGRTHEGTDIMAPRGAFVVSPTEAVVTSIGYGANGGNYVYTANPGGERYYFAHLDSIPKHVKPGLELDPGDLIGYVGNTGNASGAAPHLHFGIYRRGAQNPYPRLTEEFTLKERVEGVERMLEDADSARERLALARTIVAEHGAVFREALQKKIRLSKSLAQALIENPAAGSIAINGMFEEFGVGASGSSVRRLQEFLIAENTGVAARALSIAGATGTFGSVTKAALSEYQTSVGISATGYVGPLTRTHLLAQATF